MLGAVLLREAQQAVPAAWGRATIRAALATTDHAMTAGAVSAGAKALSQEVLTTMLLQKLTFASTALLAAGLIAWGASAALVSPGEAAFEEVAANPDPSSRPKPATPAPDRKPEPIARTDPATIRGRVLGPDGQPVPGAKLYLTLATGYLIKPYPATESATTGADGRFAFTDPPAEYPDQTPASPPRRRATASAGSKSHPDDPKDDLTLRLVPDDVPITGRIIDLEGKPIPGAPPGPASQRGPRRRPGPLARGREGRERAEPPARDGVSLAADRRTIPDVPHRRRGPLPDHRHRPQPAGHRATRRPETSSASICTS